MMNYRAFNLLKKKLADIKKLLPADVMNMTNNDINKLSQKEKALIYAYKKADCIAESAGYQHKSVANIEQAWNEKISSKKMGHHILALNYKEKSIINYNKCESEFAEAALLDGRLILATIKEASNAFIATEAKRADLKAFDLEVAGESSLTANATMEG